MSGTWPWPDRIGHPARRPGPSLRSCVDGCEGVARVRALLQRVESAVVHAREGGGPPRELGRIGTGLVALVGVTHDDDEARADRLARQIAGLRVFDDERGVANLDVTQVGGAVLVVSQFTLYADTRRGRRPSYVGAAAPEVAEPLVEAVVAGLRRRGVAVATGRFGADMRLELVNDGPWSVLLEY